MVAGISLQSLSHTWAMFSWVAATPRKVVYSLQVVYIPIHSCHLGIQYAKILEIAMSGRTCDGSLWSTFGFSLIRTARQSSTTSHLGRPCLRLYWHSCHHLLDLGYWDLYVWVSKAMISQSSTSTRPSNLIGVICPLNSSSNDIARLSKNVTDIEKTRIQSLLDFCRSWYSARNRFTLDDSRSKLFFLMFVRNASYFWPSRHSRSQRMLVNCDCWLPSLSLANS